MSETNTTVSCPICNRCFQQEVIEDHVNKCLFLNTQSSSASLSSFKRDSSHLKTVSPNEKRARLSVETNKNLKKENPCETLNEFPKVKLSKDASERIPLAERMRPESIEDIIGQTQSFGPGSMIRAMLEHKKVPNMILWGPPGCGKTSLANVIAAMCKEENSLRFVKLSATMAGINDVKEVVKIAKNEAQFQRQTVLFMDEIHRFNKLQQDTFLPHVENGTIILIGATTENPSFSLNNALLSRCRVVVMQKLSTENIIEILERALKEKNAVVIDESNSKGFTNDDELPSCLIERESLRWLAGVSDGDARVALGALEMALAALGAPAQGPALLTLANVKDGIKRSHVLYDRGGEEHYNTVSALHKSVRAGDANAALYWTARALNAGEDPLFIARRLVRAASEDIGLADPSALVEAVACLRGCRALGMPECDVLLAQCAVRLARAPKSTEVYGALRRCQRGLKATQGALPPVPLHLRNAPTKLMKQLGYAVGYNTLPKEESGLSYMPQGMESVDFFDHQFSDDDL